MVSTDTETRIENGCRLEIEANFAGGYTIWAWPLEGGYRLLAYREVNCRAQIEDAITGIRAELGA